MTRRLCIFPCTLTLAGVAVVAVVLLYSFSPHTHCTTSCIVTDGIGKAMSFEMAKKGMNVLLISRTETKLVDVECELKAACPSISVEHLAIDYSNFDATLQVSIIVLVIANLGVMCDARELL